MRLRPAVLCAVGMLLGGCTEQSAANLSASATTQRPPAAAAGAACPLLDFQTVEQVLGVAFDVAAGQRHQATKSCVLQQLRSSRPDLTLSVTPTSVDAAVFRDIIVPDRATAVTGLGKAAYRTRVAAGRGYGPGLEIGWLARDGRFITLRYTAAAGTKPAVVDKLAAKLLELARTIDGKKL